MTLSAERQRWLHAIGVALLATGSVWAVAHYGVDGADAHVREVEVWSMKLHGAAAMGALVVAGTLVPVHLQPALRRRRRLASGLAMAALLVMLGITGYGLYYLGDEDWRRWTSGLHLALGVAACAWFLRHRRGDAIRARQVARPGNTGRGPARHQGGQRNRPTSTVPDRIGPGRPGTGKPL